MTDAPMTPAMRAPGTLERDALSALELAGVDWVLLRGAPGDPAGDLDLAMDDPGLARVRAALQTLGLAEVAAGPGSASFLGYDPGGDRWVSLDASDAVRIGPVLVGAAEIMARARADGPLRLPDADDAWWLELLHEVGDRRRPRPDRLRRLGSKIPGAAATGPASPALRRAIAVVPGLDAALGQLIEALGSGDGDRTAAAVRRVRAVLVPGMRGAIADGVRAIDRGVARRRSSVCVALLGPDGVGKSTLAASLVGPRGRRLEPVYLGLYGRAVGAARPARVPGLGLGRRLIVLARARARVARLRAAGRWIVLDRHPMDGTAVERGGTTTARIRRRLLAAAAPRPDLIIVLDAPVDVLLARKQEHGPERLAAMLDGYRRLARRERRARPIAADRPPEAVRRAVQEAIAAWLADRRPAAGARRGRTAASDKPAPRAGLPGTIGAAVRRGAERTRDRLVRAGARVQAAAELRRARRVAAAILEARSDDRGSRLDAVNPSSPFVGRWHVALSGACVAAVRDANGTPAILRLGRRSDAARSVRRSARALRALALLPAGEWQGLVPDLLDAGRHEGWSWLLERPRPGEPARDRPPGDETWVEPAARAIGGLHQATAISLTLGPRLLDRLVDRRVDRICRRLGKDRALEVALRSLGARLHGELAGRELSLGWVHGDYWAGNILLAPDGSVAGVIDWDSAGCPETPAADLVHLLAHARRRRSGLPYGAALVELLRGVDPSPAERSVLAMVPGWDDADVGRAAVALGWLCNVDASLRRYPRIGRRVAWVDDMVGRVLPWL